MIKTLLLSYTSAENSVNHWACFVYNGENTKEEFPGTLKEAVTDLISEVQKFCSCDVDEACRILCEGYQNNIEEWDSFAEEHNQPLSETHDYQSCFGNWYLFHAPCGTIGSVRGMYHWHGMYLRNDISDGPALSLDLS
jgi:hypothetical protein